MKKELFGRLSLAIFAALFIIGFAHTRLFSVSKSPISTSPVLRTSLKVTVSSSGKTIARRAVDLKFQTSGLLTWVGVAEGDRVAARQAIATLDRREVQANLTKALRDYASERNDFEESKNVTYRGYSLPNTVPSDTVKRILEKNQWDLDKAVVDVELKSLAVQLASLVTPIAGIVTGVDTPIAGVNITPASAVFQITDPASIVFRATIDEEDIGKISAGQEVQVVLDAFEDTPMKGNVATIALTAETSSGGSTVFPIEIALDNPSDLRVGLNGDATITVKTIDNALVVPSDALREEDGKHVVYVKSPKEFRKVPISLVESGEAETAIDGNLSPGDEVVVKGFEKLPKEGK